MVYKVSLNSKIPYNHISHHPCISQPYSLVSLILLCDKKEGYRDPQSEKREKTRVDIEIFFFLKKQKIKRKGYREGTEEPRNRGTSSLPSRPMGHRASSFRALEAAPRLPTHCCVHSCFKCHLG